MKRFVHRLYTALWLRCHPYTEIDGRALYPNWRACWAVTGLMVD